MNMMISCDSDNDGSGGDDVARGGGSDDGDMQGAWQWKKKP